MIFGARASMWILQAAMTILAALILVVIIIQVADLFDK